MNAGTDREYGRTLRPKPVPPATPGMEPLYGSSLRVPLYLGPVGIGGLVAETSCLGMCCEDGVAVVVQPHDEWFAEATADDVPTLMTKTFGAAADGTGRGEPATTD